MLGVGAWLVQQCGLLCMGLSSRLGTPGGALTTKIWVGEEAINGAAVLQSWWPAKEVLMTFAGLGAVRSGWAVAAGGDHLQVTTGLSCYEYRGSGACQDSLWKVWGPLLFRSTCSAGLIWASYLGASAGSFAHYLSEVDCWPGLALSARQPHVPSLTCLLWHAAASACPGSQPPP